jgi:hypothetical protein
MARVHTEDSGFHDGAWMERTWYHDVVASVAQSGRSARHRSASTVGRSISAEAPGMARVHTEDSGFHNGAWMERTPSGNGEGGSLNF